MKERIPFVLLAGLSLLDVLFGAAVLPEVRLWALLGGGLVQLAGAVMIGFSDRIPAAAGVVPLVVGSILIIGDPGWRELYAHGALLWIPVATAIVTINLVKSARRPVQVIVGAAGLVVWIVLAAVVMGLEGQSVVTAVLAAAAPILSGACISLFLRLRRAQQDRLRQARRDRALAVERVRFAERQRLAEELHDTVTHRVTLLVMQANVLAATSEDTTTRTAAESIGASGRTALEELREFLGLLRQGPPVPSSLVVSTGVPLGPPGGDVSAESVSDLVEASRELHPDLAYTQHGSPSPTSGTVTRTVHRLVQEGLTNVHKHAPESPARVTVTHGETAVDVEIGNGPSVGGPIADTGSGQGLAALRRRVQLLGGTFEAGHRSDGGFVMSAHLPHPPDPQQQGPVASEER